MKRLYYLFIISFLLQLNVFAQSGWNLVHSFEKVMTSIAFKDSLNGYALSAVGAKIYRTSNGGYTWEILSIPDLNGVISKIIFVNDNLYIGVGQGGTVIKSTDNGNTWTEVLAIPGNYPERNSVICLAIHNDGIVLGCVENRKSNSVNYGMIRSTDSGLTWSSVNIDLQPVPQIRDFAWDSNNSVFAASSKGLLQSTNNGLSWFYTNGVLPTNDIRCLVINSNNSIYIGTGNKGVFRSADNGVTWNILNVGISDTVVNTIIIGPEGYLFAGTEHDGIFRSREPITSVNNENEVRFGTFALSQNYPNPFNPTTVINYSVPKQSKVKLMIYDALGREVANLVNEEKPTGNYKVEFDGSNLTSGIYLYKIHAGSYSSVKKMILVK